jgi:sugar/nucleoside kinase (ribokinase family)
MAMAAASISVTRMGAQSSAPLRTEIDHLISIWSVSNAKALN